MLIAVQIRQGGRREKAVCAELGPAIQIVEFAIEEIKVAFPGANGDLFDPIAVKVPGDRR
jgi:hypothetical protein